MYGILITVLLLIQYVHSTLWSNGVVHYAINKKDYDLHSQDEITATFARLQKEICVKFFDTPLNYTTSEQYKILYISNPGKTRVCPPQVYDYRRTVIDMPIGYKCINQQDISRIIVDMLKASVGQKVSYINSYDLVKRFKEKDEDPNSVSLLTPTDRNYINWYYHDECQKLTQRETIPSRRSDDTATDPLGALSAANIEFYSPKIWKWGIIPYHIEEKLRDTPEAAAVLHAIRTLEESTCIQFQKERELDDIKFHNVLNLGTDGADRPNLGFVKGIQNVKLSAMASTPGHKSHTLNLLMRHIGIPMMSNRMDRDNYITVNWNNIEQDKQHYFERESKAAYIPSLPYDFKSVTHAPANYFCHKCDGTSYTVTPVQDHLWERLLMMGQSTELSEYDVQLVNILYAKQCLDRRSWGSARRQ